MTNGVFGKISGFAWTRRNWRAPVLLHFG